MAGVSRRPSWGAALTRWYRRHARPLPWRERSDPYAIWISEVMLQQTTVAVVEPYYHRFMTRFPTVAALAAAREDAVLAVWSGLGYYRRARSAYRAAKIITQRHGGQFPRDAATARALPGVGRYTVGAVLSIAFDARLAVVDGNVRRVLTRVCGLENPAQQAEKALYELAESLLPRRGCGEWNQALMELGATVCTPQAGCPKCPLRRECVAFREGLQGELPGRIAPRRAPVAVSGLAALVRLGSKVLLCRAPRQKHGALRRLWEVPHTGIDDSSGVSLAVAVRRRYGLRLKTAQARPLGRVRHTITFRRLQLDVIPCRLLDEPAPGVDVRWVDARRMRPLAMSALARKILALAADAKW